MTKLEWESTFSGIPYPLEPTNFFVVGGLIQVDYTASTNRAFCTAYLDGKSWSGMNPPAWNINTTTGLVNGTVYNNEGMSTSYQDEQGFTSNWNYKTVVHEIASYSGSTVDTDFRGNYTNYYSQVSVADPNSNALHINHFLTKGLARGSISYLHAATAPAEFNTGLSFYDNTGGYQNNKIRVTFSAAFKAWASPPTPPTPPTASTYKNYLFLDVELGDSTAGLTANQYCIPIVN